MKLKGIKTTVYGSYAGYSFAYKGINFIAYKGNGDWYLKSSDLDTDGEIFKSLSQAKERAIELIEKMS